MKKYNCLIIGCGAQGAGVGQENNPSKIINFAHAIASHNGFNKICFVDDNNKKSINAMKTYGGWATTMRYACEYKDIDVAIITTPDDQHYEILKQLTEYSLKLVICEKPICTDLQQAREIVELYKDKGIPLLVNYTRRFLPYYDHLEQYGKPKYAHIDFNRGWIHSASHAIDFFNMIGIDNYGVYEANTDYRFWNLVVYYDDYTFVERRYDDEPVWDYYDKSHMHIINNAYQFLEGKEEIKCTGEDALKALEKCYELMEGKK